MALDTERFAFVPVGTLTKRVKPNHPIARSGSELRRSTRESKKTERYQNFANEKRRGNKHWSHSKSKRNKNAGHNSDRLSSNLHEANVDMGIPEHEHDIHTNENSDDRSDLNRRMLSKKMEARKLIDMGHDLRISLTNENIRQIFSDNLEHFINIRNGKVKTWRSTWYKSGKEGSFLGHLLAGPFSDTQQDVIYEEVKKNFLKDGIPSRFVDFVLIPEVYIRIYQVFFDLSKEEAEHNLKKQHLYYSHSGSESSNGIFIK